MAIQTKKNKAIFPDIPRGEPIVQQSLHLTTVWHHSLTQLYQALQRNFSNEGLQLPILSSDDINNITAIYQPYIGKVLPQIIPNISGSKVYEYSTEQEKTFIINFTTPGDASTPVVAAAWKTVTLI